MNKKTTPYIAKIVEIYKTSNGNIFCREDCEQEFDHHLDWKIFIPEEYTSSIQEVPFWGIIVTDYHSQYFNRKSRLTCRIFSTNKTDLNKLFEDEVALETEIENRAQIDSNIIELYYSRDFRCDQAMKEIKNEINVNTWLNKHKNLFDMVTIRPNGLPVIADSHVSGVSFKNIQKFVTLYDMLSQL